MLTREQLAAEVESGAIDTVLIAVPDMQGRLQGKRLDAGFFLDEVAAHGTESCSYLLAVDVEMNTVDGYRLASWDQGYGDFAMRPDLATLRRVPWHPVTALVMADLERPDGAPVTVAPRQILRAQIERLAQRDLQAMVGTELEFLVFRDTYEQAFDTRYAGLVPANQYNVDYSLQGTGRVEPLLRRIRTEMTGAGMRVESAKGECNLGQHEIGFRYDAPLVTCDNHALYKLGARRIAAQAGMSLTFMAKFDQREGNSCHIHLSLRSLDRPTGGRCRHGTELTVLAEQFLSGLLQGMRELTLFFAPNINSYKRYVAGSFAPTAIRWGPRQPHLCHSGRRPRGVAPTGKPRAGRRRQSVPGVRGHDCRRTRRRRPATAAV